MIALALRFAVEIVTLTLFCGTVALGSAIFARLF